MALLQILFYSPNSNKMWLSCHTQEEISKAVDVPQRTISDIIASFSENSEIGESAIFRNFEPKIYNVWNFANSTNEVKH